jgi:hypothetical protein
LVAGLELGDPGRAALNFAARHAPDPDSILLNAWTLLANGSRASLDWI